MEENKFNYQLNVNDVESDKTTDTYASFKEKLEQVQQFPDLYTFKFIIKGEDAKIAELQKLLPDNEFIKQPSKTGKYVSITVKKWMQNADEVVDIYKKVGEIKEVIML